MSPVTVEVIMADNRHHPAPSFPQGHNGPSTQESLYRRVIKIRAEDSPNVRYAIAQRKAGIAPDGKMLVPGILPWHELLNRRARWDKVRQTIGLDAEFYEGAEVLLYPPDWLVRANRMAIFYRSMRRDAKIPRAIGIDPGEGEADTSWCCIDSFGILEILSYKTIDTTRIVDDTIDFIRRWDVPHDKVILDAGGGGKQHAHRLRKMGYKVRTVAFGESLAMDPKRGIRRIEEKVQQRERQQAYLNRRAEMYDDVRTLLDPSRTDKDGNPIGFGIPAEYEELIRQLSLIPLLYDKEGKMRMLSKNKRNPKSGEQTLIELLGCSPDQADALALAVHGLLYKSIRAQAGAMR